ncbi:MAG: DUF4142 domain-containing protein [Myxococcota bacterium]|nr:DUF4142 domain-containing protein [Myxococcota bacterium]
MNLRALIFATVVAIPASALAQSTTTDATKKPAPTSPSTTDKTTDKPTDKPTDKTAPTDKPTSTDKAKPGKGAKLTTEETAIVAHLHHVNVMEIDMGKLAQKNGTAAVKRYGEMMVTDHSAADKELVSFAKQRGIARIPAAKPATETDRADHKQQMEGMAALKKLKAADFDREYLRMMVESHDKELARSDVAMSTATDTELKTMLEARKTTLQRHADAARDLQKGNAQASAMPAPTTPK